MSRKEVQDSIHRAKPARDRRGKPTFLDGINISKKAANSVTFAFSAKGVAVEDKNKSFAYYTEDADGKKTYFVKFATAGPAQGRMLNTSSMTYRPGDENKYENDLGRMTYEFRKVNETIFNLYIKFLKTANEKYILQAEREVVNV